MMDTAIRINAEEIPPGVIAAEMQFHPAATPTDAWDQAATALAVRALLLQEADRLDVDGVPEADEGMDEARIRTLLAQEIVPPEPDEATCLRWFHANRRRFRGRDVYEAAHILLPAAPEDKAARETAKAAAATLIATIAKDPASFATLARAHSSCASAEAGGALGQMSRGDLVEEVETFVLAMEPGQLCPVPVASHHGFHVLRLDRLERASEMDFDTARPYVERELRARAWQHSVAQYLRLLTGRAEIEGLPLEGLIGPADPTASPPSH